jgi:carbonic anhydrase/acetyltransferase-like protein (isoleucine patch superfamily)
MEPNKYVLSAEDTIQWMNPMLHNNHTLYRMIATRKLHYGVPVLVDKGDLGGYVAGYNSVSQYGECWVIANKDAKLGKPGYTSGIVAEDAQISENVRVLRNGVVYGRTTITGGSQIDGEVSNALLHDVLLSEGAVIHGDSRTRPTLDGVHLMPDSKIVDSPTLQGRIVVGQDTLIGGRAAIQGVCNLRRVQIGGNAKLIINGEISAEPGGTLTILSGIFTGDTDISIGPDDFLTLNGLGADAHAAPIISTLKLRYPEFRGEIRDLNEIVQISPVQVALRNGYSKTLQTPRCYGNVTFILYIPRHRKRRQVWAKVTCPYLEREKSYTFAPFPTCAKIEEEFAKTEPNGYAMEVHPLYRGTLQAAYLALKQRGLDLDKMEN